MNLMPLNEALVHLNQQYLPVTPNNSFLHDTWTCKERVMNFVKYESAYVNIECYMNNREHEVAGNVCLLSVIKTLHFVFPYFAVPFFICFT